MFAVSARAADDDDAEVTAALDEAAKTAAEAGIKLPGFKNTPKIEVSQDAAESADDEDKPKVVKTGEIKELPAWVPKVPGFVAKPGGSNVVTTAMETGTLSGTSSEKAADLAAAWKAAAEKAELNVSRSSVNSDLVVTECLSVSSRTNPDQEAELTARSEKGVKGTAVTVKYSMPVPPKE
jgi:hypothetical protein